MKRLMITLFIVMPIVTFGQVSENAIARIAVGITEVYRDTVNKGVIDRRMINHGVFVRELTGNWALISYNDGGSKRGYVEREYLGTQYIPPSTLKESFLSANPTLKESFKNAIITGNLVIGMTDLMVVYTWGPPNDINITVTASGRSEQWVYGSKGYLYFDNGVLTAMQQ